jgi:homoaconitase/3-isopropylmalate dehydratase large subunit
MADMAAVQQINDPAPKNGDAEYDPANKYNYIYKCLLHNISKFTQLGNLDLCGDKTTCGHGGFGKAGSGLLARQMNKPGITSGTQTFLVSDVH